MTRDRRDRDRADCPDCGRNVTVRRDGGLMAHRDGAGRTCAPAAWRQRVAAAEQRAWIRTALDQLDDDENERYAAELDT